MTHSFGVAGFGTIGKLFVKTLQEAFTDVEVIGIADPNIAEKYVDNIPVFQSHRELLSTPARNIIVATPPACHVEIATDALADGRNVLLEKPPARSVRNAVELIDLSRKTNAGLFFGYHARYNRSVSRAETELREASVRSFHANYSENVLAFHSTGWVLQEGMLADSGINLFSILAKILPGSKDLEVRRAELVLSRTWQSDIRDKIELAGREGYPGLLEMDWLHQGIEQRIIEVSTSEAVFKIDITADRLERNGRVLIEQNGEHSGMEAEYKRMLTDYINCIDNHRSSVGTLELSWLESCYALALKSFE